MKTRPSLWPTIALALFMASLLVACGPSVEDACDKDFMPESFDCVAAVEELLEPCRNRDHVLACFARAGDYPAFSECEENCWTDEDSARQDLEEAAERIRETENR